MHHVRNVVLLVVACAAAACLVVPAATAQMEAVEYRASQNGPHCQPVGYEDHVVTGGCEIKGEVEGADFTIHTFLGELTYNCYVELTINIDENGHGYMTDVEFANGEDDCSGFSAEEETGGVTPWEFRVSESESEPTGRLPASVDVHLVVPLVGMQSGTLEGGTFSETNCCMMFDESPVMGTMLEVSGHVFFLNEDENGATPSTVAHVD